MKNTAALLLQALDVALAQLRFFAAQGGELPIAVLNVEALLPDCESLSFGLSALPRRLVAILRHPAHPLRRFHVGPGDHASPAPAACRSRCRCFRRASFTSGNPRATASRITAETDTSAASASASSAAAVAGCTVTRSCFE